MTSIYKTQSYFSAPCGAVLFRLHYVIKSHPPCLTRKLCVDCAVRATFALKVEITTSPIRDFNVTKFFNFGNILSTILLRSIVSSKQSYFRIRLLGTWHSTDHWLNRKYNIYFWMYYGYKMVYLHGMGIPSSIYQCYG